MSKPSISIKPGGDKIAGTDRKHFKPTNKSIQDDVARKRSGILAHLLEKGVRADHLAKDRPDPNYAMQCVHGLHPQYPGHCP